MADYKINHMTGRLYKMFTTSPSSYYDYQVNRVQDIIEDIAYSESRTIFAAKVLTGGSTNINSQASSGENESLSTKIFNYLPFSEDSKPFRTYAVKFRFTGDDADRNQIPDPNTALDPKNQNILISLHNYAVVSADIISLSPGDLIEVREEDGTYYVNKKLDGTAQTTPRATYQTSKGSFTNKKPRVLSSYKKRPCVAESQIKKGSCYNSNFANVRSARKDDIITGSRLLTFEEYKTLSMFGLRDEQRIFKPLMDFIAKHESLGDYEANNLGKVGTSVNTEQAFGKTIQSMTMKEFRAQQDDSGGIIYASGRYQIVPTTLRGAIGSLNLPDNLLYNAETQDALCIYLAITKRRRLGDYLMGKSSDLKGAGNDLSFEWASLPLLGKVTKKNGQVFYPGESIYQGDPAGNKTNPDYVAGAIRVLKETKKRIKEASKSNSAIKAIIDKYGK